MRNDSKCSTKIWTGKSEEILRKLGSDAYLAADYMSHNPYGNMLGVFHLPIRHMSIILDRSNEQSSHVVDALCQIGFCHYDEKEEYVWVTNMVHAQEWRQIKALFREVPQKLSFYCALLKGILMHVKSLSPADEVALKRRLQLLTQTTNNN